MLRPYIAKKDEVPRVQVGRGNGQGDPQLVESRRRHEPLDRAAQPGRLEQMRRSEAGLGERLPGAKTRERLCAPAPKNHHNPHEVGTRKAERGTSGRPSCRETTRPRLLRAPRSAFRVAPAAFRVPTSAFIPPPRYHICDP